MLATAQPFPFFADLDGTPLDGGHVYFGEAFDNPETAPIQVYWDADGTQPIAQPATTLNGFVSRLGTPSNVYASGNYSISVRDRFGRMVYYCASAATIDNGLVLQEQIDALGSTSDATKGAGQIGYGGALNYAAKTVGGRLMDVGASPRAFGGVGDGVADDTAAINACLLYSKTLDLRNRSWRWTSTINLPIGYMSIDARGATLLPATGTGPCLAFDGAREGLYILGGFWAPTSGSFLLRCSGTSDAPTTAGQYARQIRLEGVHVTSSALTGVLDFQQAVRQVFIDKCMFYAPSGINASGKCVEVHIGKSIIYSATAAAGTYGIKLRSTGGTVNFNEGWHFDTCTIDAFETTFDVTDIFGFTTANCYIGSLATGYAFQFQAPSTNQCESIVINGCVINGRVRFVASASGQSYNARIGECIFTGVPGITIALENNASQITVSNVKFKAGSSSAVGVVGSDNNSLIVCSDLDFDSTYVNGVILNGANGSGCVIGPLTGPTSGDIAGAGRSNIVFRDVPITSAALAAAQHSFNASDLGGAYAAGSVISTVAVGFARGERGWIVVQLPCLGMNAATQRFDIAVPSGMVLPGGSGWSGGFIHPSAAGDVVSARIPYYCTADGSGDISITNAVGNTVTLNSHGYFGLERAW